MGIEIFLRISTNFVEKVVYSTNLLERRESMDHHLQAAAQLTYVPAIALTQATLRHSLQKIPLVVPGETERICGVAQRVGYTGNRDEDLAIYRLKVKASKDLPTITLPGFFVIEDGIFTDYEQWCDSKKAKREAAGHSKKDVLA